MLKGRRDGVCITQSQVVTTTWEDPEAADWSRDHGTRVCQPINTGGVLECCHSPAVSRALAETKYSTQQAGQLRQQGLPNKMYFRSRNALTWNKPCVGLGWGRGLLGLRVQVNPWVLCWSSNECAHFSCLAFKFFSRNNDYKTLCNQIKPNIVLLAESFVVVN